MAMLRRSPVRPKLGEMQGLMDAGTVWQGGAEMNVEAEFEMVFSEKAEDVAVRGQRTYTDALCYRRKASEKYTDARCYRRTSHEQYTDAR